MSDPPKVPDICNTFWAIGILKDSPHGPSNSWLASLRIWECFRKVKHAWDPLHPVVVWKLAAGDNSSSSLNGTSLLRTRGLQGLEDRFWLWSRCWRHHPLMTGLECQRGVTLVVKSFGLSFTGETTATFFLLESLKGMTSGIPGVAWRWRALRSKARSSVALAGIEWTPSGKSI